ncbi:Histidine-specific methyltransferase, SAM-dependent [Kalmanozyma brasiliensis GHG001]|uniref:CMP/dCMP-type deaminase domain-containing protein n=1 Tax=Kalmanozyma brasiliensis (strain GHG001) TaxID=1365824 RepID=V5GV94_KALBG|nr:Histidine-specific methyltransferase, SAM-dependent [Kalmanozyma brasiliensis GHG001]EST09822.1 Histidine-specific methyltransferase, SAM-dependent [Kalmanozyma brasiliensis GHG001]
MAPSAVAAPLVDADPVLHSKSNPKTMNTASAGAGARLHTAPVIDLYSGSADSLNTSSADDQLRREIISGLQAKQLVIPGKQGDSQDLKFAYRKTLPTTILYDEQGLILYDKLTAAPEYYLYNAELQILKDHGPEIALRIFGHSTATTNDLSATAAAHLEGPHREQKEAPKHDNLPPQRDTAASTKERWGDSDVGRFNGGVNAEEGLDGERAVGAGSLVELGAGSLKKTIHLLRALKLLPATSTGGPSVHYYALDLDKAELERTLRDLRKQEATDGDEDAWTIHGGKVGINGLWATYDAGLDFIGEGGLKAASTAAGAQKEGQRCLLWLGSSIGNFDRKAAAEFLAKTARQSMRAGDTMLISIDRRNKPAEVALAYNDPAGLTRDFIMNGLNHADRALGGNAIDGRKFEYFDRYNAREGRHESYYRAKEAHEIRVPGLKEPIPIQEGELIHMEASYKFSERETLNLFDYAGLRVVQRWSDKSDRYDIWLVEKPSFHFSNSAAANEAFITSQQPAPQGTSQSHDSAKIDDGWGGSNLDELAQRAAPVGLPSLQDWKTHWDAWNCVTLTMIPKEKLHEKPIDLRHICLFYLGHIPAFLDIHVATYLKQPHTNDRFSAIFERGIDPHMDDITQCNPHSEVPTNEEDWPTLDEILTYQQAVQARVEKIYEDVASGDLVLDRRLARMLWMTLEHISLHLETLLYMLMQSPNTKPPVGFTPPDWASLSKRWQAEHEKVGGRQAQEQRFHFEASSILLGHDDDDTQDFDIVATRPTSDVRDLNLQLGQPEFGWDNEHPRRRVETKAFSISALPISNAQYRDFLKATNSTDIPSSWIKSGSEGGHSVRTFYGPVDMDVAQHWPVQASGKQLAAFAAWKGGRLPSHAELRMLMDAPPEALVLDLTVPPFHQDAAKSESSANDIDPPGKQAPPIRGSAVRYVPRDEQSQEDLKWMQEALAMAQEALDANEVPVGGVFVRKGEVIARGRNRTNELLNATRHAELEAIDHILSIMPPSDPNFAVAPHSGPEGDNPFKDTTLYVTIEPCIMCGAALRQIGIGRVVFGAGNERFGGNGSVLGLHDDDAIVSSPGYESVGGYLRDEAIMMLRRFYVTENTNAPKPQNKSRRVLKTEIHPPGISMHGPGTVNEGEQNAQPSRRRSSVNPTQGQAAPSANVGFRNWHPVPASLPRYDSDGTLLPGHNGGVWEWTSTPFLAYDGFQSSALYPGYSSDFFDGKHSVVVGGSYATSPSIAGRRTVVNYYQTAYPYIFGGGRVAWDK